MADYNLSVQVIGAKELKDALASVDGFAREQIRLAINKTAIDLERKARDKAPHLHGGLYNSIHTQPAVVTQNNIEAKVGTNLVYARAQEYGTQGMTIHSHSKTGKQFTYIGNIKPHYYMRDAKNETKPELTDNLQEALRKIVSHLATKGTSEL
jgi:hypothetical protein